MMSLLIVWEHATKDISIQQEQSVDLLRECVMIRDNVFTLPDFYTVADVQSIILYICSLGWILSIVYYFVFILCLSVRLFLCLLVYCVYTNFIIIIVLSLAVVSFFIVHAQYSCWIVCRCSLVLSTFSAFPTISGS